MQDACSVGVQAVPAHVCRYGRSIEAERDADDEVRWLTPGVGGIGAASFLSDLGHEIPTSLLPSLLTSTLGAPASALGLIEGISDGGAGLARFVGGALADDPRRRRSTAVGGYAATAVLTAATGGATAVWQVAVLRAGGWIARGLRVPSRNALLADVVSATRYGTAYGFERMMDNLGAVGGPLLAIGLVAAVGTRNAIWLSVVPGLLAVGAIVYAIRHTPTPTEQHRRRLRIQIRPVLQGPLRRLFIGIGAFELGNVAATLLILRATEQLAPTRSDDGATTAALVLYALYNVAATLASVPAGKVADRTTARRVLVAGIVAFAVAYAGFAIELHSWWALVPWFVLAGIGIGCVETAEHAAVATFAPEDVRGSAFGLLAATQSLGNLAASSIAGVLWTLVSPSVAFVYAAVLMLVALGGLGIGRPTRRLPPAT